MEIFPVKFIELAQRGRLWALLIKYKAPEFIRGLNFHALANPFFKRPFSKEKHRALCYSKHQQFCPQSNLNNT